MTLSIIDGLCWTFSFMWLCDLVCDSTTSDYPAYVYAVQRNPETDISVSRSILRSKNTTAQEKHKLGIRCPTMLHFENCSPLSRFSWSELVKLVYPHVWGAFGAVSSSDSDQVDLGLLFNNSKHSLAVIY